MNREIKFRIWANNKFYNKCLVGNTNDSKSDEWTCPMVWLEKTKEWVHCDNGIICQFTGLHDKNGKEIYEGDVVKINYKYKNNFNPIIAQVKYSEEYAQFVIVGTGQIRHEYEQLGDYTDHNIEIIGNIYENNELLGGE